MLTYRITKLFRVLLVVIFFGVILHAPLTVIVTKLWPDGALLFKAWKEILMALAGLLLAAILTKKQLWGEILRDRLVQLVIAYIVLHIVLLGFQFQGKQAALAGLLIDLRYVAFFLLVYVGQRATFGVRELFVRYGAYGAVIVIGFGVLQRFLPADILRYIGYDKSTISPYLTVDENQNYVRINSTLRGPNPLGAYTVMLIPLLFEAVSKGRLLFASLRGRGLYVGMLIASIVVLWTTYSRSAQAGLILAIGVIILTFLTRKNAWKYIVVMLLIFGTVLTGVYYVRDSSFVSHVILHEDPDEGNDTNSNDGHWESLIDGSERFARQPLGAGIGSTGSASLLGDSPVIIENHYLYVAHESGWLGLGLFLTLFGWILSKLWKNRRDWLAIGVLAGGVGLAAIGVLLPVWADDTVSVIWWGLAAVAIAPVVYPSEPPQKLKEETND